MEAVSHQMVRAKYQCHQTIQKPYKKPSIDHGMIVYFVQKVVMISICYGWTAVTQHGHKDCRRSRQGGCHMQPGDNDTMRKPWVIRSLCMECAIRHHDFREILGHEVEDDPFPDVPLSEAWIDGRRYRLTPGIKTERTRCSDCARTVTTIYTPIGEDTPLRMPDTPVISQTRRARYVSPVS